MNEPEDIRAWDHQAYDGERRIDEPRHVKIWNVIGCAVFIPALIGLGDWCVCAIGDEGSIAVALTFTVVLVAVYLIVGIRRAAKRIGRWL